MVSNGNKNYHESNRLDATATGADEIGKAFQRVGGTAGSLGVSFDKVSAMIAVISSRTREGAETIGQAMKSIFARMESLKEKGFTEDDGTKVNQVAKALHQTGVELIDNQGQFRDLGTVLDELGKKWDGLDSRTKAYVATTLAGTYQQSRFLNLMEGYKDVLNLTDMAVNSAGTSQQKYNLYLEGTQAHLDRLKTAATGIWQSTFDSAGLRSIMDMLTSFVQVMKNVIDEFGFLTPTVLLASTAFFLFKKGASEAFMDGLVGIVGSIKNLGGSIKSLITWMGLARLELKTLGLQAIVTSEIFAGLRAVMMTIAPIAILTGVTAAISALVSHQKELSQMHEQLKNQNDQVTISWTKNKEAVQGLISQYEALSNAQKPSAEESAQLTKVQNDLNKLMPNLTQSIDAQGNAHLKNSKAIQDELNSTNKLVDAKNKLNYDNVNKDFKDNQKNVSNLQRDITDLSKPYVSPKSRFREYSADERQILLIQKQRELNDEIAKGNQIVQNAGQSYLNLSGNQDKLTNASKDFLTQLTKIDSKITNGESISSYLSNVKKQGDAIVVFESSLKDLDKQFEGNHTNEYNKALQEIVRKANSAGIQIATLNNVIDEHKGKVVASSDATFDLAKIQDKLTKTYEETEQKVAPLNDAIDKLKQGHELTSGEISSLLKKYPDLFTAFTVENGHLKINIQALEEKRKAEIAGMETSLDAENKAVKAQEQALIAKLKMYGVEVDAINSIADAKKAASMMVNADPNASEIDKYGAENAANKLLPQLEEIAKAKASLKALEGAAGANFSFQDSLNTPKSSGSSPTPFDETAKYQIDEYAQKLHGLDDQLKQSEAVMTRYKDTSKEYGDELNKQLSIHKQKQDLVHEEADSIRAVDDALQHRLDTEKLDIKQRNTLLQQLEQNKVKVSELSNAWWDYEKTIEGVNKKQEEINNTLKSEIIDKLKQGYEIEKKIQEEQLKINYDAQVKSINDKITADENEKKAIDEKIASLQEQWKAQDDLIKIAELQNEKQNIMQFQNQELIDANGNITYTYDAQKVLDIDKKIADEKTRISRDAQKKQYDDQKSALDKEIELYHKQEDEIQRNYEQQKQDLDNYWSYRLSDYRLNQEAENMIAREGYQGALRDAQSFFDQMNYKWTQLQQKSIDAGKNIAMQLGLIGVNLSGQMDQMVNKATLSIQQLMTILADFGQRWKQAITQAEQDAIHAQAVIAMAGTGATYNSSTGEWSKGGIVLNGSNAGHSSVQDARDQIEENARKWRATNDPNEQKRLHDENIRIGNSVGGHYDESSGKWNLPQYKDGGWINHDQVAQLHGDEEVIGQKLTSNIMNKYGVKPSEILANMSKFMMPKISLPSFSASLPQLASQNTTQTFNIDRLEFPNVRSAEDAGGFAQQLGGMFKRAYYNSTAGGMS